MSKWVLCFDLILPWDLLKNCLMFYLVFFGIIVTLFKSVTTCTVWNKKYSSLVANSGTSESLEEQSLWYLYLFRYLCIDIMGSKKSVLGKIPYCLAIFLYSSQHLWNLNYSIFWFAEASFMIYNTRIAVSSLFSLYLPSRVKLAI